VLYALQSLRVCAPCANFLIVLIKDAALGKDILTTKITKATKGSDILVINFVLFVPFVVIFDFLSFGCGFAALDSLRQSFLSCLLTLRIS